MGSCPFLLKSQGGGGALSFSIVAIDGGKSSLQPRRGKSFVVGLFSRRGRRGCSSLSALIGSLSREGEERAAVACFMRFRCCADLYKSATGYLQVHMSCAVF